MPHPDKPATNSHVSDTSSSSNTAPTQYWVMSRHLGHVEDNSAGWSLAVRDRVRARFRARVRVSPIICLACRVWNWPSGLPGFHARPKCTDNIRPCKHAYIKKPLGSFVPFFGCREMAADYSGWHEDNFAKSTTELSICPTSYSR